MRIALDVTSTARREPTGVALVIRRLVKALAQAGPEHSFVLATRASPLRNIFMQPEVPGPNCSRKLIFEGLHPFFFDGIDIFHDLDARLPDRKMKAKTVVLIHDVFSALQSSEFASPEFREMKKKRYEDLARRADRLVCESEAVKRDILATLPADPARVVVIPAAGGEEFYPRQPDEIKRVCEKYGLHAPYFIYVGTINKRKNVPAMIEAFAIARERAKSDAVFVVAGRSGFGSTEIENKLQNLGAHKFLKMLGYVPDADVAPLYCGAQALVFATLYEGFGLPAVEAMSCGCPVIGATTGSLPEVLGDAGLLADPASMESIAEQILRLMQDESLRQRCSQRGLLRAREFSWEKSARNHLALYHELVSQKA